MNIEKAITGFVLARTAENLAKTTLDLYKYQLALLTSFLENKEVGEVSPHDLRRFLVYLRDEHEGPRGKITPKSVYNYWVGVRAFFRWTWAEGLTETNPTSEVAAPRYTSPPPDPFTKSEVQALLKAVRRPRTYHELVDRNRAILLLLLDTGIRAGELEGLRMSHLDIETGKLVVKGKRDKTRHVFIGKATRKALWRYLIEREDREDPAAPLFLAHGGRPLSASTLRLMVKKLGKQAGVADCFPHRFRHTFAVTFLRNGGDVFNLQRLLGHSSLDMVRRYVKLADVDTQLAHRKASPADNWGL